MHSAQRKARWLVSSAGAGCKLEVQYRSLTGTVEADTVRGGIQNADECRDEAVVGERFGKLVVDLDQRGFQVGAKPERHPQHRLHLRDRKCRSNAMAGRVTKHGDEPLIVDG